jgi:hypothetical protein
MLLTACLETKVLAEATTLACEQEWVEERGFSLASKLKNKEL